MPVKIFFNECTLAKEKENWFRKKVVRRMLTCSLFESMPNKKIKKMPKEKYWHPEFALAYRALI